MTFSGQYNKLTRFFCVGWREREIEKILPTCCGPFRLPHIFIRAINNNTPCANKCTLLCMLDYCKTIINRSVHSHWRKAAELFCCLSLPLTKEVSPWPEQSAERLVRLMKLWKWRIYLIKKSQASVCTYLNWTGEGGRCLRIWKYQQKSEEEVIVDVKYLPHINQLGECK